MAGISAAEVKKLRDATGLGMMDCKKALEENNGDIEAAKDSLRAKGLAAVEKRAGRATKEGLISIKSTDDNKSIVMIEMQCETDFCARNEEFKNLVEAIVDDSMNAADGKIESSDPIETKVHETLAKIGENMSYSRGVKISAAQTGRYLHHNNKVGVVVGLDGEVDDETMSGLCQHIAFSNPVGITADDIPAEMIEKERTFAKDQAMESGKPEEIVDKIVDGKMKKYVAGLALIEQAYVKDDKKQVKDILGGASITSFARFAIGDE